MQQVKLLIVEKLIQYGKNIDENDNVLCSHIYLVNTKENKINGEIVFVASNRMKAYGLERARNANIDAMCIKDEALLLEKLAEYKVDLTNGIFYNTETKEAVEVRKNEATQEYSIYKGNEINREKVASYMTEHLDEDKELFSEWLENRNNYDICMKVYNTLDFDKHKGLVSYKA